MYSRQIHQRLLEFDAARIVIFLSAIVAEFYSGPAFSFRQFFNSMQGISLRLRFLQAVSA